jgi:hypothetical protein
MSKPITVKTAPGTAGGQIPARMNVPPLRRGLDIFPAGSTAVELPRIPPGKHQKVVRHGR